MYEKTFKFRIPSELLKRISEEQKRTGASQSEITRRALDLYLTLKEEKAQKDAQN